MLGTRRYPRRYVDATQAKVDGDADFGQLAKAFFAEIEERFV